MSDLAHFLAEDDEPQITRGEGRPERGKYLVDTAKVPSVTTITGLLNVFLGKWANDHGLAGRDLAAARDWDRATDIGDFIHKVVVATIHEDDPPAPLERLRPEQQEGLEKCLTEWSRWYRNTHLTFEGTELPLVSAEHRFGGTIDAVARDPDGNLCLVDWKTSKALYTDYLFQVAAYGLLWNETQLEKITGGYYIVRFAKEFGDVKQHYFPELDAAAHGFLLLRELYDIDAELKRRVK